jgi:replication factor C subunit 1
LKKVYGTVENLISKERESSVLSRFRFSGGRIEISGERRPSSPPNSVLSRFCFRVGESKFWVGAAHPAHPVDKSLRESLKQNSYFVFLKAIFSTVAPCSYVRGHLRGMVNFSSFFGQRSRANKNARLLNEIEKHVCLKTASANKQQFNLDYLPYLSRILISPLKQFSNENGIEQCISLLDDYYLNRDDFQTMMELNTWDKTNKNLYEQLDTNIKSSLTRNYNKTNHRTPYAIIDIKKLKKSKDLIDEENDEEQEEEEEEQNSTIEEDAMIKSAKKSRKK